MKRCRRGYAVWAVALACCVSPSVLARAQPNAVPGRFAVEWEAPPGCGSADRVRREVVRLLGGRLPGVDIAARVDVRAVDSGYVLSLRTSGGTSASASQFDGERELEGESCDAVADAVALIIALMVDPRAGERAAASNPSGGPSGERPEALPSPRERPERATARRAAERRRRERAAADRARARRARAENERADEGRQREEETEETDPDEPEGDDSEGDEDGGEPGRGGSATYPTRAVSLSLFATADAGALPRLASGAAGTLELALARVRLGLGVVYLPSQDEFAPDSMDVGGSIDLLVAQLFTSYSFLEPGGLELGPLVFVEVGSIGGESFGVTAPGAGATVWAAMGAGVYVALPLFSWLALEARADLRIVPRRPRFVVDGLGEIHRPSTLGARGYVGLRLSYGFRGL